MYRFIPLFAALFLAASCKTAEQAYPSISYEVHQDHRYPNSGVIEGNLIYGDSDEPAAFVEVRVIDTEWGAYTDADGFFRIGGLSEGVYHLQFRTPGYAVKQLDSVEVFNGKVTRIKEFVIPEEVEVKLLKPMIYLYPEDTTTVHVSLEFQGELKYTYPDYRDGWKVTACPDGTLFDGNGRSYYGLFWEGPSENPLEATDGFVIASDSIVSFLEEKLYQLGLTDKEANEFIVFWYPILSESPYNHIQFATTTYENQAKLNVAPHPETVIRVMMVYEPLDAMKEVPLQLLPPRPKRNGFTLVEWGGTRSVPRGM